MAKANKKLSFITGPMVLRFPKITKPDTKGEYADGKFKTDAIPTTDEGMADLQKKVMDFAVECFGDKKASKVAASDNYPMKSKTEKDGEEVEFLRTSTKSRPKVYDAKGKLVRGNINIGGGTIAKLSVTLSMWEKGVTCYFNAVQILVLETFGGGEANFEDATAEVDDADGAFVADDAEFVDETDEEGNSEEETSGKTTRSKGAADF